LEISYRIFSSLPSSYISMNSSMSTLYWCLRRHYSLSSLIHYNCSRLSHWGLIQVSSCFPVTYLVFCALSVCNFLILQDDPVLSVNLPPYL
jgi:hypothetical protein